MSTRMLNAMEAETIRRSLLDRIDSLNAKLLYAIDKLELISRSKNFSVFNGDYAPTNDAMVAQQALIILKGE